MGNDKTKGDDSNMYSNTDGLIPCYRPLQVACHVVIEWGKKGHR